jgi:hypothetical protein
MTSGANPTIMSYNASVVKIYDTTKRPVRYKKIKIFLYVHVHENGLAYYNGSVDEG